MEQGYVKDVLTDTNISAGLNAYFLQGGQNCTVLWGPGAASVTHLSRWLSFPEVSNQVIAIFKVNFI